MSFAGITNPRDALKAAELVAREDAGEISLLILEKIPSMLYGIVRPGALWGCTQMSNTGYITSTLDPFEAAGNLIRRKVYFPEEYGALAREETTRYIKSQVPIPGLEEARERAGGSELWGNPEKSHRIDWLNCYDETDYHHALGFWCYLNRKELGLEFLVLEGPDFGMHTGKFKPARVSEIMRHDNHACMNHAFELHRLGCRAVCRGEGIYTFIEPNGKKTRFDRAKGCVEEKCSEYGVSVDNRYHLLPNLAQITGMLSEAA